MPSSAACPQIIGSACAGGSPVPRDGEVTVPLSPPRGLRADAPRRLPRGRKRVATYDRPVSVTPIRLFGDPVLRTPAAPVVDFDRELRQLVADLTDTMFEAGGARVAAPHMGVRFRAFPSVVAGGGGHP